MKELLIMWQSLIITIFLCSLLMPVLPERYEWSHLTNCNSTGSFTEFWLRLTCKTGELKLKGKRWFELAIQFSHSVVSVALQPHGLQHARPPCPSPTPKSPPKLMSIVSVVPSNHLILCRPLLLLPSIFPSIRVFSNESALHIRWPKYWSFSFNISPSNEHPGLSPLGWTGWISLHSKTVKSLLQHHSSKASILQHSVFFIAQL